MDFTIHHQISRSEIVSKIIFSLTKFDWLNFKEDRFDWTEKSGIESWFLGG